MAENEARSTVYRGYGNDNAAGGRLVTVEVDGEVSPLPHHAKHSPSGMSWGFHGSGAADLARSLLIDALGEQAQCSICEGSGEVVYDVVADADVPARVAGQHGGGRRPEGRYSEAMGCYHCENGISVTPPLYQPFKRDVVANLPGGGWTLTRAEILEWVQQHPVVQ